MFVEVDGFFRFQVRRIKRGVEIRSSSVLFVVSTRRWRVSQTMLGKLGSKHETPKHSGTGFDRFHGKIGVLFQRRAILI